VQIGFGSITCQRAPGDARAGADLYRDSLELCVEAERLGFDSVWLSEHHFLDDSYLPSLLVFAAAVAARTTRIAIGTDVLLAPLHEPLRLAEDAAVADLLSGGRLVLGIAQGWRPEEFEALRVPLQDRHRRFEDAIATLRQAWADGLVTGGATVSYPGVSVTPKPARPGGPPLWIGGISEPAVRRAGRLGDGFMANWSPPGRFARWVGWVREELERSGHDPGSFTFSVVLPVFAWEEGDPWPLIRNAFHHYVWKYEDMADARARLGPPSPPPRLSTEREAQLRDMAIVGPPGEVAERLRAYEEAAGGDVHVIAECCWPALDRSLLREAMTIAAERVVPALRASG
jgi:alkanesulfonate monooxygenase SsuD/methylene tetrahydromethanopterin reductase-like flavin-dependent oxidoreductase (luciferase family)